MHVLGLDIGGANLKCASSSGQAVSRNFDLWREPDRLGEVLTHLLLQFPPADLLAVTMTAELADCFATKADGVSRILQSVEVAAHGTPVQIWQTLGEFVSVDQARAQPLLTAAANWQALATWAGRLVPKGNGLLLDIGSTTTDIIPLTDGVPCPRGLTDSDRLLSGELVYSGVRRTPLCAVASSVPFRGGPCPLAAELFATTHDLYLLLEQIPEDEQDRHTANGQPATRAAAHDRLARMLCCDRTECSYAEALLIARHIAATQRRTIAAALNQVLTTQSGPLSAAIISGSGSFLARQILTENATTRDSPIFPLADRFSPALAEAACAFAVAELAVEGTDK